MTNIGASADGAVMITFFAPPWKCAFAFSMDVKTPVDSTMYSALTEDHLMFSGFILSVSNIVKILVENSYFLAINHQLIAVFFDSAFEPAMSGIILDEIYL